MIIYWSMIAVNLFFGYISSKTHYKILVDKFYENRSRYILCLLPIIYIIFWVGMRSGFVDTYAYIKTYKQIPIGGLETIFDYAMSFNKDQGFYLIAALFKNFISIDYHWWLMFIAIISGICIFRVLYKYSDNFHFSIYLFITMGIFIWMMNGVRQFLVISILFGFSDWLIKEKKIQYILLILLMALIHNSCLLVIPICFFVNNKPWSKKMLFAIILMCFFVFFADKTTDIFISTIGTEYADTLNNSEGSSLMRTIVAFVPVIIAFVGKNNVEGRNNSFINLCINMSIFAAFFYLFASFTNGILVGRFPMYFYVYNLILIPWLLRYCFKKETRLFVYLICIACYLIYFCYQAYIAGNFYYISDLTGLIK